MQNRLVQHRGTQRLVPLASRYGKEHVRCLTPQDVPTVHKNLCQNGYVWVTMVIERALFLILAAVWVIKTHFFASRCSLGHFSAFSRLGVLLWPGFFLTKCPNYSINTPNQTKHPVYYFHVLLQFLSFPSSDCAWYRLDW